MRSIYTVPLLAATAIATSTEYTPEFVTKSEHEIRQFTSYDDTVSSLEWIDRCNPYRSPLCMFPMTLYAVSSPSSDFL